MYEDDVLRMEYDEEVGELYKRPDSEDYDDDPYTQDIYEDHQVRREFALAHGRPIRGKSKRRF